MSRAVYTAQEIANLLGVSEWQIYNHRDDLPVAAIRVGRRLVWPRAEVDRLLGLDATAGEDAAAPQAMRPAAPEPGAEPVRHPPTSGGT